MLVKKKLERKVSVAVDIGDIVQQHSPNSTPSPTTPNDNNSRTNTNNNNNQTTVQIRKIERGVIEEELLKQQQEIERMILAQTKQVRFRMYK